MTKNLVFCSDGTGQEPKNNTNVFRTCSALRKTDEQVTGYDPGVGTRFGETIRGKAFGRGLAMNVRDGYEFVRKHYRDGDRIYLFGFSRGAYTVRSLASFIALVGLVPPDAPARAVGAAWETYKCNREESLEEKKKELDRTFGRIEAPIEAVCVWDTVGSIGRQTRTSDVRKKLAHPYHRMTVYPAISRVYHAVSLDERRTQYFPHLLQGQGTREGQVIEEVWFAGVHSDVGGGYGDDKSLGEVTLAWMLSKVGDELDLVDDFIPSLNPDPLGPMHNNEKGPLWSLFQKRSRPVPRGSVLHRSVVERIEGPLRSFHPHREPSGNYQPLSLNLASFSTPPDFRLPGNYRIAG